MWGERLWGQRPSADRSRRQQEGVRGGLTDRQRGLFVPNDEEDDARYVVQALVIVHPLLPRLQVNLVAHTGVQHPPQRRPLVRVTKQTPLDVYVHDLDVPVMTLLARDHVRARCRCSQSHQKWPRVLPDSVSSEAPDDRDLAKGLEVAPASGNEEFMDELTRSPTPRARGGLLLALLAPPHIAGRSPPLPPHCLDWTQLSSQVLTQQNGREVGGRVLVYFGAKAWRLQR